MRKKLCISLVFLLLLTLFTACRDNSAVTVTKPPSPDTIRVAAMKGPTAMGLVKLMEDNAESSTVLNYDFTICGVDEIIAKISRGELDFAAVPANLASVLYNNMDGAIQTILINTLGVLYLVERGTSISSVDDLRGKTLYVTGKGSTPEFALNYVLTKNGLDPERDLTIEYKSDSSEIIALLERNKDAVALLPQPFVTAARKNIPDLSTALDWTEQWDAVSDGQSSLITGVTVVSRSFAESYPAAVSFFAREYQTSVMYVNNNPDEAALLIEKYGIVDADTASIALPSCNITLIAGNPMEKQLGGYLGVLYAQNPESIGGKLPDENFYFK